MDLERFIIPSLLIGYLVSMAANLGTLLLLYFVLKAKGGAPDLLPSAPFRPKKSAPARHKPIAISDERAWRMEQDAEK